MKESNTYWDACIASLPPEKRAAAERAYREIADGGENGMFPKLFLLLEAHAAYINTMPEKLVQAGEEIAAQMRDAAGRNPGNGGMSEANMEQLLTAIHASGGQSSVVAVKTRMEEMTLEVKRLNRAIARLRYFRVSTAIFLMFLTAAVTTGGLWYANRENLRLMKELQQCGLELKTDRTEESLRVVIIGPVGRIARINEGVMSGVAAEFPLK